MTKLTKWLNAQPRLRSVWASTQSEQSLRLRSMGSYGLKISSCWQRRFWSDWADAQADLSLCWAHSHFIGFVMRQLIYSCNCKNPKLGHSKNHCNRKNHCNYLNIWTVWFYHKVMCPKDVMDGQMVYTMIHRAVWSASSLFAQTCLSEILW